MSLRHSSVPIGLPFGSADVAAAAERIRDVIVRTPAALSQTLSSITGAEVVIKFENLQFTGSFKERGALNRLLTLDDDERARGVVAMSAGNHAQGLAHHAARLGITAVLVMPEGTPMVKVGRTRALGAEVVVHGATLVEAHEHALTLSRDRGLVFVPPYDCPVVMAGQGTVAREFLEQEPDLDVLVVPVGGGGLFAGSIVAAHDLGPHVEMVGVQVDTFAAFDASLHQAERSIGGETIAEGIAVARPSARAVRIARTLGADTVVVDDAAVEEAVALLLEIEKVVSEGAGAAPLAALLAHPQRFAGRRVGLVLSGGNVDLRVLASAMLRALARSGRLTTLSVSLPDRPGALHRLTGVLAAQGANVVELSHDRLGPHTRLRSAVVGVQVETADRWHRDAVVGALRDEGFDVVVVESFPGH
ncbi:MAG: threonine ammonia-lyase [Acidimicrobiales bacterium]|nr:threonine ammonia-lyase [Acidimicrobiales bacterium]